MKLEFRYSGFERSVESILEFTDGQQTEYWSGPFFHFYPEVDRERYRELDRAGKKAYLTEFFAEYEQAKRGLLEEKLKSYNGYWKEHEAQIVGALEEAFELSLMDLFNDMCGYIAYNPICPRYLPDNAFDVFYLNSERGALGMAIHEVIHFVWFYVWNRHFGDKVEEYETPHLKWILSEMVVDTIMRDERLASINPYYQNGGCVYNYFYTMNIGGKNILETLYGMYCELSIVEFMEKGYQFCLEHEREIRGHIERSEDK